MTKYNLQEFNAWLEADKNRGEGLTWTNGSQRFIDFVKKNDVMGYTFEKIEEVSERTTNFGWNPTYLAVVRKWMVEVDNKNKQKEQETKSEQIKELSDILFPNQPYNFTQLKQEITRLKVKELAPQARKEREELEELINTNKNKAGTNFEKIIDLLLETQKQIIEKKSENDELVQAQLKGQLIAYQNILEGNLTKEELQILLNKKTELIKLEEQLTKLQIGEQQTQIEIPPKK